MAIRALPALFNALCPAWRASLSSLIGKMMCGNSASPSLLSRFQSSHSSPQRPDLPAFDLPAFQRERQGLLITERSLHACPIQSALVCLGVAIRQYVQYPASTVHTLPIALRRLFSTNSTS
jgi:hypothetical protein